ncbi:nicotinate-nucleotide adenylyltransferase [Azospira sp. I13]|uniref:nicotinate-nucleotide adenylyltransferase n=1 Tax=Azospira sp. I13 TaxID=1765050 RepID=UPI001F20951B|nr:nicotinate-nucleotide adenylyltransferase [Azospira sp. I13]
MTKTTAAMPEGCLVGIFGGTFDPIHHGHLRLAQEAVEHLALDQVLWIPAGQPPHREMPAAGPEQRLAMVRCAVADNPAFAVDGAEVFSQEKSYTVLTLERLRQERGAATPLVLLTGADAFAGLPTWHRWRDILELAHVAVVYRPGFSIDPAALPAELATEFQARRCAPGELAQRPGGGIVTFPMTPLAISATQIRQLLAAGRSPRYLLPEAVFAYIRAQQLYLQPRNLGT